MGSQTFDKNVEAVFESVGVTRRDFMKFCGAMAAILGLPPVFASRIANAIEREIPFAGEKRPSVLWLNLQSCTGCTESFTRSDHPSIAEAVLTMISLDYHETLLAASGKSACQACESAMEENRGKYILVVEGAVPVSDDGTFCTIAGKSGVEYLKNMSEKAAFVIALGTCASYGGLPAAKPNPTAARSVDEFVSHKTVVRIPGCPPIGDVLMATIVHFLFFGKLPALDSENRPQFAYGKYIHEQCRRHYHFENAEMVLGFNDDEYRGGYCLFPLGCKGAFTKNACSVMRWNMGTAWCVGSGHPCVGCSEKDFWDKFTPIYSLVEGRNPK